MLADPLALADGTTLILQGRANSGQIVSVFFSILIVSSISDEVTSRADVAPRLQGAFSLAQMAPLAQSVSFALAAATSIFSTIDRVPVIDSSSPNGLSPEKVEGVIEVTDLDFIYPSRPSVQVLYKFNAVFPRGKMTAVSLELDHCCQAPLISDTHTARRRFWIRQINHHRTYRTILRPCRRQY